MHFARAEYLHFLWLLPLLALFFVWSFRRRRRRLEMLISPSLAPRLTGEFSRGKAILRALLLLCCFAFFILALARPQWGMRMETVRRRGVDILVALDTSYSMNAEDVAPARLAKAKAEVRSLLARLRGDRIGLISFAGSAVVQCPLTLDYGAINLFLDVASTESIPDPGTSLAAAITAANAAFIAKERKYKVLVILTDGEDLEGQVDSAVEKAKKAGVIIYAIGIGSPDGRPIPVRDDQGNIVEYRKDPNGQVVISRLDEKALAQIASQTGGRYFRATTAEGELDDLYGEVSQMDKKELESKMYQNFEDRFQYPLTVAVFLLAVEALLSDKKRPGIGRILKIARRWRPEQGSREQ
jgi:Ca-activated chloride channel family protein